MKNELIKSIPHFVAVIVSTIGLFIAWYLVGFRPAVLVGLGMLIGDNIMGDVRRDLRKRK